MRLSIAVFTALCVLASAALAQTAQSDQPPAPPPPTKVPKPKSRLNLLHQMQNDLDAFSPHAKVDDKDRKKLEKCHETLIDAIAQQQRFKSVNAGKVNGCLKDLDKILDAGAFPAPDRDKLLQDSDKLGESVGKPHRIRLPQPL